MTCTCNRLNYVQPKPVPASEKKAAKPKNVVKIKLADNPKDIVIRFADKETLLKTLRELLGV